MTTANQFRQGGSNLGWRAWFALTAGALGLLLSFSCISATPASAEETFKADSIDLAYNRTCAITDSGQAYCWGRNQDGQLGDGTNVNRSLPTPVQGMTSTATIATGTLHTCAVSGSGQVFCWGNNQYGQLGDNTTVSRSVPTPVQGITDAKAITAGREHSCAIRASGAVLCWGRNNEAQLGDNSKTNRLIPVQVRGIGGTGQLSDAESITGGVSHTCAVRESGQAVCWGRNDESQLGDGSYDPSEGTSTSSRVPVPVLGLTDTRMISAGGDETCAVRESGQAVCWGFNGSGQLGDNSTTSRPTPTNVQGLADAQTINAGSSHTCAVRTSGQAVCWGSNGNGKIGDGIATSPANAPRLAPSPVVNLADGKAIVANDSHTCALRTSGQAVCWGFNGSGQIGDDTTTERRTPTDVLAPAQDTAFEVEFDQARVTLGEVADVSATLNGGPTASFLGELDPATRNITVSADGVQLPSFEGDFGSVSFEASGSHLAGVWTENGKVTVQGPVRVNMVLASEDGELVCHATTRLQLRTDQRSLYDGARFSNGLEGAGALAAHWDSIPNLRGDAGCAQAGTGLTGAGGMFLARSG